MNTIPPQSANPRRRDLLTARFSQASLQIASLMVQARPEKIDGLTPILNNLKGVEVHNTNNAGKMILSIEAASDRDLLARITEIEKADGVITASLVYHQIVDEDDLDE